MRASSRRMAALAAAAAVVVLLLGGYAGHWSWTGINGRSATLWDWLHLLLLPVVVGLLPLWVGRETRLSAPYKSGALVALAVFAVVVLAGYVVPWAWTGFVGNTLWNWLELIALPVALALTPILDELRRGWNARQSALALIGLAGFVAAVVGGYAWNWSWTGFQGNTLWDWMHLLLLPLLLPMVVVPALKPRAMRAVTSVERDENGAAEPSAAQDAPESAGQLAREEASGQLSPQSAAGQPAP